MNKSQVAKTSPSETDKHEIAGRMYQALDIARAIEDGQIKTVEEVLTLVKTSAVNFGNVLECDKWVYSDCCLDINESIKVSHSLEYHWPDDGKLQVSCPTCKQSISIETAAKELNSPLHPAHCDNCETEFDLYHDGKIEITFIPPEKNSPEGEEIRRAIENMVFDPNQNDCPDVLSVELSVMTDEQIGYKVRQYAAQTDGSDLMVNFPEYDVLPRD